MREFGVDIAYTPMLLADSFSRSEIARNHEFRTCPDDTNVVAQFGAKNPGEFARSIEYIEPYVDRVDLNCGCPQRWAIQEGIGASLLNEGTEGHWDRLCSIVEAGLEAARPSALPVSVKIRILPDTQKTIQLARRLEALGISWLTVHGRTRTQKPSEEPDFELIKLVKDSVSIPVIANGNVFTLADAERIQKQTGVNGIMSARGLLENPGLFAGHEKATWEVLDRYIKHAIDYGTVTAVFQHHVQHITENALLTKAQQRILNALTNSSIPAIVDYLDECRQTILLA